MATRKTTTKRTAGGTTGKGETFTVPRRAEDLATAIRSRVKRSPNYWEQVLTAMRGPIRAAEQATQLDTRH